MIAGAVWKVVGLGGEDAHFPRACAFTFTFLFPEEGNSFLKADGDSPLCLARGAAEAQLRPLGHQGWGWGVGG